MTLDSLPHRSSTIQSLPTPSPSSSGINEKKPSLAPSVCQDLAVPSVPPAYRKDCSDWVAIFDRKFVQNLNVDLIRSTSQPRSFLSLSLSCASLPYYLLPSIVCSIHFSPDGHCVAAGCNKAIYIYNIKTGVQVW